ncbi:hypothetical protein, partial [Aureimonas sp. AU20]
MTSVNTNAAALTALRTLQNTNQQLEAVQGRISTGLKIGEAKDNAAYWSISTTLKSDNKSLSTVKDALGLGAATVDTAYQGLTKAKDVLDEIKSKLTAASQDGVNRDTIQAEIKQLQEQLKSIASTSVFAGENLLSVDSSAAGYSATKTIVASASRDSNGALTIGTIKLDASNAALFDANADTTKSGIIDASVSLKDAKGKDLSFGGAAMTGNKSAGGLTEATVTGSDATKATSTFTGAFTATTLDLDDELTLSFKADNAASATTVKIKVGDVAGAGIAKAGTIGSVDELATVVNNVLKSNGITNVAAVKDGNSFALQRTDGGLNKTVEVTAFSGADKTFDLGALTVTAAAGTQGQAFTAETQTFTFATTASAAGTLTFTLGTGETGGATVAIANADTAIVQAQKVKAFINGNSTLSALVTASDDGAGVLTLTYKTAGDKPSATMVSTATATTINSTAANSTATAVDAQAYVANGAKDTLTIGGGATAVFADADDKILFQFTDSLVGGGTTQTVEITRADLQTAGLSNFTIDGGTSASDMQKALSAAFTRQAATNSIFGNYTVSSNTTTLTLTRNGPGVAGQDLLIVNSLTAVDPSSAIASTFGLTKAAGIKQGTNAVEASAANTISLPVGGIALDADDNISFDIAVGTGSSKNVKIDA